MTVVAISLLVFMVFMNRYILGLYLKKLKGKSFDETISGYEPTVTIVTPLYNEGSGIYDSIKRMAGLNYPMDKLNIVIVDDCSTDDSYIWAQRAASQHPNVTVLRNLRNMGKRKSINHVVRTAVTELIVSVDSDVLIDPDAIRNLVARFVSPRIAAVGGRIYVSNPEENWLTRMQTIKYFYSQSYLKNIEQTFHSVMCLSGCLTAYRRSVLLELEPILEKRNILGIPIKYGEDRFLTRQIVKAGYETLVTMEAACYTVAPTTLDKYFSQQLRWRRSNIVDFFGGLSHAWRLHPVVATHYLSLFGLLMAYPLIVLSNILDGTFWELAFFHLTVLAAMGMIYHLDSKSVAASQRVHPIYFLAMVFVMPVTYIVFTPLAFFTLDSGSWETRVNTSIEKAEEQKEPWMRATS